MFGERRIVDNRTFLLGLDELYRDAIKTHERGELLRCVRHVAAVLHVSPRNVPVEGYYAEDELLTEYFCLMRAFQAVDHECTSQVASLPEFQRLREVTSAPLYGKPLDTGMLLPTGLDALARALSDTKPEWSLERLTEAAYHAAEEMDDFSLVGLAARIRDPIVLTATRESVVLYASVRPGSALSRPPPPKYIWNVDTELAEQARRFIDAFHVLFGDQLPPPEPKQAEEYWLACQDKEILGRCVRLGYNDAMSRVLQYHWAICGEDDSYRVQEFWHPEVWTTERYRKVIGYAGRCPNL